MRRLKMGLALCLLSLFPWAHGACAETAMYVFTPDSVPMELWVTAHAVAPPETVITLTFAGDCTLGGEPSLQRSRNSFRSRVEQQGMSYPFAGLQGLFATDDFSMINLEGVFSDSDENKAEKKFNFIGDVAYAGILTAGNVECVNLANNHTRDFGGRGFDDTVAALSAAGVGYFDENTLCVLEKDGMRIGLTATLFTLGAAKREELKSQMALLRELGCAAIIHQMHAGQEYAETPTKGQRAIAQAAAELGAMLVIGHHPHVVQGVELLGNVPVVYSLGNCSFGGNLNPQDDDAALLRAELRFRDGVLDKLTWALHPISQSGEAGRNNFQPVSLSGEEATSVIEKIQNRSDMVLQPFQDGLGAKQESIDYQRQEE